MKQRILFTVVSSIISLVVFTGSGLETASDGAPASSTGAPGEQNCTMSGCHTSYAANTGPGTATLTLNNGITTYEPGQTYTVNININQNNVDVFGFEWVALADNDSSNAGTIAITDAYRTWILPGANQFADRKYVTYTYPGSQAQNTGSNSWSFDWTAPATDIGPVTLYAATVAGNKDGTDLGDYVYTKSLTLSPASTGTNDKELFHSLEVYPNPAGSRVNVSFSLRQETELEIALLSLNGQQVISLFNGMKAAGGHHLPVDPDVGNGLYLLRLSSGNHVTYQKLSILR